MKLTIKDIENLASEIISFLEENELNTDVLIFFNNKRIDLNTKWDEEKQCFVNTREINDNISPVGYFQNIYTGEDEFAKEHILSMLYENDSLKRYILNDVGETWGLDALFKKYGLLCEPATSWGITAYPIDFLYNDNAYDGIEYISYEEKEISRSD